MNRPDWEHNDIVLVVHFNSPLYEYLLLLATYRDIFPLVVFTGPKSHPDVIHCPEGSWGQQSHQCLSRAILLYPNHNGYLFCHFDLLPIFYNLEINNLQAIWIPTITHVKPENANSSWWIQSVGKNALNKTFSELKANSKNNTLYARYMYTYQNHSNKKLSISYSDIFYLPHRFVDDWLLLTTVFTRHKVYHDFAFATITQMIVPGELSKNVVSLLGISWVGYGPAKRLALNPSLTYMHRIDLRLASEKYIIKVVVQRSQLPNEDLFSLQQRSCNESAKVC
ncbi:unnamed protein product [Rotaria magnacalcarata]|nr:unnamed protein product [Rotaria magnacalcarata]CAF3464118.1 unnamed protein product [Rotaria socialis]CAF2093194.1 unnamed protein product [Rotaria magnacalcarata]CAF4005753.1 unnamed protein product [Rotaria magnacalcarata]CAF4057452.1 unnamed protein product [Rotaria magnacalcarata]